MSARPTLFPDYPDWIGRRAESRSEIRSEAIDELSPEVQRAPSALRDPIVTSDEDFNAPQPKRRGRPPKNREASNG